MSLSIWESKIEEGYCVCLSLEGFEDAHKLKRGNQVGDDFPEGASFRMDPDFPKDIQLADNIRNSGGFVLVSRRLKDELELHSNDNIEFHGVTIYDHKDRVASDEYYVVNPILIVDMIDTGNSDIRWNSINPDVIASCKKIVLKDGISIPEVPLFRLKFLSRRVVVHSDVATRLLDAGFSGLKFTELAEFRGF